VESNWIFKKNIEDHLDTVTNYHRIVGEQEDYEEIKLEAKTEQNDEEAEIRIAVGEKGAEIIHETNVHHTPLFDILDNEYPPKRQDIIDVDGEHYRGNKIGEGFNENFHSFQYLHTGETLFDVEWLDNSIKYEETLSTPFQFRMVCYDDFGLSLDSVSVEPVQDIMPVMLRTDLEDQSKGKLLKDMLTILDYGPRFKSGNPSAYYIDEDYLERLVDASAERYDPER